MLDDGSHDAAWTTTEVDKGSQQRLKRRMSLGYSTMEDLENVPIDYFWPELAEEEVEEVEEEEETTI
jgi:hypothetical protein